jgi:parallel beta-helix repeat protein
VGGRDRVIRDNVVRDFGGAESEQIAYGMFLKGNSRNGLIERNLVICSANHGGGWRLGISLGGGGTGGPYCEQKDCSIEHHDGMIRNNIVLNCSGAGIYIKRAVNSHIYLNTLLLTEGIDVQLAPASAIIRNNYLDGTINARKGATIDRAGNRLSGWGIFSQPKAVASYMARRISDYHVKYPSVFSEGFIQDAQGWIEATGRWLGDSRLGLGHDQTLNNFPGLVVGDLAPSDPALLRAPTYEDLVDLDFWGNRRNPDVSFLGAIDLSVSPCDVRFKLRPAVAKSGIICLGASQASSEQWP